MWKQPNCPFTNEWIKLWPIYTVAYYSASEKEEDSAMFDNMVESWGHFARWNKPVTEIKYYMIQFIWGV